MSVLITYNGAPYMTEGIISRTLLTQNDKIHALTLVQGLHTSPQNGIVESHVKLVTSKSTAVETWEVWRKESWHT